MTTNWQTIDTAPKDEAVLLYVHEPASPEMPAGPRLAVGTFEDWYQPEWVDDDGDPISFAPSHWHPIPKHPDQYGQGAE